MSSKSKTGGPAFLYPSLQLAPFGTEVGNKGMFLRDWFAGMALQGLCACPTVETIDEQTALMAYKAADHMLKARES